MSNEITATNWIERQKAERSRDTLFEIEKMPVSGMLKSVIRDFFALFSKKKKTDIMQDFGVEKGIFIGLKYLFWLGFYLPIKVLLGLLHPRWEYFRIIEKATTPLMQFGFAGAAFDALNANFARYVDTQVNEIEADVKPDLASIERVLYTFRLRRIVALVVAGFALEIGYETIVEMLDSVGAIAAITTLFSAAASGPMLDFSGDAISSDMTAVGLSVVVWWAVGVAAAAYFSYLLILIIRLFGEGVRSLFWTRKEDLEMFIVDALDYSYAKAREIYRDHGNVAKVALAMTLENFVLDDEGDYNHFEKMDDRRRLAEIRGSDDLDFDFEEEDDDEDEEWRDE